MSSSKGSITRDSLRKRCNENHKTANASRKSALVLNMQLRVACADGHVHAVRHLLEEGGEPFHIVSYKQTLRITSMKSTFSISQQSLRRILHRYL